MNTITPAHLRALGTADPDTWAPLLSRAIEAHQVRNAVDFLANVLHETTRLHTLRESLNYTVGALTRQWPSHFSPALAASVGRIDGPAGPLRQADQYWIAEHAYGGRMGNGVAGTGDGFLFRGAGGMMTTGRANYAAFAQAIGWTRALVNLPDYLATPEGAAESAATFWSEAGCDGLSSPAAIRQRVNGGTIGLAEVVVLRAQVAAVLGGSAAAPRPVVEPPHTLTTADLNEIAFNKARNLA